MYSHDTRPLLALLLCVAACSGGAGEHAEHDENGDEHGEHSEHGIVELAPAAAANAGITTTTATIETLMPQLETTGRVDFDQTEITHVSPRVPGRIQRLEAYLGDTVKKGQTLAWIDATAIGEARSEFLQARTDLDVARKNYEREKKLLEDKITSEKDYLEAEGTYRKAEAAYRSAHDKLQLLGLSGGAIDRLDEQSSSVLFPLRAPIAGRIVAMHATLGEVVDPSSNLFTVGDLDELWVWIDVYERDLSKVHVGDQARVSVESYPDQTFQGTVSYIGDQVDPDSRAVRARVDVPNTERLLKPGMFASIRLSDPHAAENARQGVVVPAAAVQRDGDASIVFVAAGDHRYERRQVTLGLRSGDAVEIASGVEAGEEVVTEGGFILKSEAGKGAMGGGHSH